MNRDYYTEQLESESESVAMFIGTEVEHSPAYGKSTLFVVGVQDINQIINVARKHNIEHVYFGANMSFPKLAVDDFTNWSIWERMIKLVLEHGFKCTLDIPVDCVEGLLESGLCEHYNFIPMISVKLPYIQQLGYNATIKLDDKDFNHSNPGVWVHQLHNLMNFNNFTDWSKYRQDQIIQSTNNTSK